MVDISPDEPKATPENGDQGTKETPMSSEVLQKMMRCIQQSSHLDLPTASDLPKIYAVGDQSTGKSSVIEALSGIKLPRGEDTCTRCPIEINLMKNELNKNGGEDITWTCKIYLVKEFSPIKDYNLAKRPKPESESTNSKKAKFWPWVPRQRDIEHFASTHNKSEVCDLVERAQMAILSPGRPSTEFQPRTTDTLWHRDNRQVPPIDFSPNIIRLKISGPKYYNLSFFDLPGVISIETSAKKDYLPDLVEALVRHHISNKNSVVLLTLPMDQDLKVEKAMKLVRDENAVKRTLGVFTKPDRIKPQSKRLEMLRDSSSNAFTLGHGYHAVMLKTDTVTTSTSTQSLHEEAFFQCDDWNKVDAAEKGVENLAVKLEKLLQANFERNLPELTKKLNALVVEANAHLDEPPDVELPSILRALLAELKHGLLALFKIGSADTNGFRSEWGRLADDFKSVLESGPALDLVTPAPTRSKTRQADTAKGNAASRSPLTPRKRLKASGDSSEDSLSATRPTKKSKTTKRISNYAYASKSFNLEQVRTTNKNLYDGACPDDIAPRAVDELNRESVAHWDAPAEELVKLTGEMIGEKILQSTKDVFHKYSHTPLYRKSQKEVRKLLNAIVLEQQQRAQYLCHIELNCPQTRDHERFSIEEEHALEFLKDERASLLEADEVPVKEPTRKGGKTARKGVKDELHDEYSLEVKIMAVSIPDTAARNQLTSCRKSRLTTAWLPRVSWTTFLGASRQVCFLDALRISSTTLQKRSEVVKTVVC